MLARSLLALLVGEDIVRLSHLPRWYAEVVTITYATRIASSTKTPTISTAILYQTEDGRTRIDCRFEGETIWLTQTLMAELFQTTLQNINLHLQNIYEEGELDPGATIKSYLMVRQEGTRQVRRPVLHYSLDAILAVGFRVRSHRGTQFRKWANARLSEYLVKGFAMDDARLKNPPGEGHTDYFDELLERIRDIRASERRFYQKVLDIYATSIDYQLDTDLSQQFFATVQNKMHWAAHGHTAAEIVHERADGEQPLHGHADDAAGRRGPQGRRDDREELPDRARAAGPPPHREPLHRVRRAAPRRRPSSRPRPGLAPPLPGIAAWERSRRAASAVRRGTCSRCPRAHPTRCRAQSGGSSPRAPYQMATISTSLRSAK